MTAIIHRALSLAAILTLLSLGPAATDATQAIHGSPEGRCSSLPTRHALSQVPAVVAEASAEVVPSRVVDVSLAVFGQVAVRGPGTRSGAARPGLGGTAEAAVAVAEGDAVEAGQLLVAFDTADLEAEIAQAEASLAAAEAQLELMQAGPRRVDVAVAEAQLAVAEASLAQATARRGQITDETRRVAIAESEAGLANAKAQERAALVHELKQRDLDIDGWRKEVNVLRLRSAELALAAAEARLAQLPREQQTAIAQHDAVILEHRAERDRVEVALEDRRAGASAWALAIAEARVAQAAVDLQDARHRLAGRSLHAPFDGVVVDLEVNVGQAVVPGQTLLTLADLATLQVETTDLSERDVAALDEVPPDLRWGMTAEVTFGGAETN